MFKVIRFFNDVQDNNRPYEVGDIYPREGLTPTKERIAKLASDENALHTPLIEEIKEEAEEKPARAKKAKK